MTSRRVKAIETIPGGHPPRLPNVVYIAAPSSAVSQSGEAMLVRLVRLALVAAALAAPLAARADDLADFNAAVERAAVHNRAAIGYLLAGLSLFAMSLGGFAAGLAVALTAGLVARSTVLREDASLAAFYLVSLALGVLIISIKGSNIDLLHVLFGTVLALDDEAIILLASIATVSLAVLAIIYRPLVLECFDPQFLRSASGWSSPTHLIFLVLVVLNLVAGFQALGTLMAVGIMLLPAISARFWAVDVSGMIVVAVLLVGGSWQVYRGRSEGWLAGWDSWDATILREVAEKGYGSSEQYSAFFPGFPLVLRLVHLVVPSWTAAAVPSSSE